MDFSTSMTVAAAGLKAQSDRMKTIAENIANANSAANTAGGDPYRRKIPTVTADFNRELNAEVVRSGKPAARYAPTFILLAAFPAKYSIWQA